MCPAYLLLLETPELRFNIQKKYINASSGCVILMAGIFNQLIFETNQMQTNKNVHKVCSSVILSILYCRLFPPLKTQKKSNRKERKTVCQCHFRSCSRRMSTNEKAPTSSLTLLFSVLLCSRVRF